jgi:Xaa-Pro dipeptidase
MRKPLAAPRLGGVLLYALVFTILVFLVLPTIIVVPMSLNGDQYLAFPPRSWSLKWYMAYFSDPEWIAATLFSLKVATLTTIAATLLGTCAALALVRSDIGGLGWLNALTLSPMIVPHIVIAVAMYLQFARLGLTGTVTGFVIAHTALAIPYVVLTVSAALYRLDPALEMAALNLGASRLQAFFRVTLPLIMPGVATGAAFAFIISLDEAVVSFFISGVSGKTLTRKLFEDIDYSLSPVIAAPFHRVRVDMGLHFSREEFAARQAACRRKIADAGLDAVLLFKQESMYYLTGYDTSGYLYFQAMLAGADGTLALLTRSGDLASAKETSVVQDITIWVDRADANPGHDIRELLAKRGFGGKRIGVEYQAFGLTAARGKLLDAALEGSCERVDASTLVDELRQTKSAAELVYVRKAAALTQRAHETANRLTVPGASLAALRAAMLAAAVEGGGDPPGVRWPIACGAGALVVRYFTGSQDGQVGANDQVTHEIGVPYRHYYAVIMHTVVTGTLDPRHREMFAACRAALDAAEGAMRPGLTFGDVYAAQADAFTRAGYAGKFLNACGYPLGATYPPTWVEQPIICRDHPLVLQPGMVLFLYMILQDHEAGLAMSLGETALVTDNGVERLTQAPRELVVS